MYCFLWQDWITVASNSASGFTAITQTETEWLDLTPYQDIVLWYQIGQVTVSTNPLSLDVQTSPVRDEAYFLSMIGGSAIVFNSGSGPLVATQKLTKDVAATPLSRWLRWQVFANIASGSFQITMRLWIAANFKMGGAGAPLPRTGAPSTGPGGMPANGGRPVGRAMGLQPGPTGINPAALAYQRPGTFNPTIR